MQSLPTITRTTPGHVLTCGDNSYGQLGLGEAAIGHNLWVPAAMNLSETLAEGQRVKDISFGGSHSSLLTSAIRARVLRS